MSARDIADEMMRWATALRGEMTRTATIRRTVLEWVEQVRLIDDGLTEPAVPTFISQSGSPIWFRWIAEAGVAVEDDP